MPDAVNRDAGLSSPGPSGAVPPITHRIHGRRARPIRHWGPHLRLLARSRCSDRCTDAARAPRCGRARRRWPAAMTLRHSNWHQQHPTDRSTTLRTQCGDNLVDKVGPGPAGVGTTGCEKAVDGGGQPRCRLWNGGSPPVNDAGRPRGRRGPSTPRPRTRPRASTARPPAHAALTCAKRLLSTVSTSVKTRNELRTLRMGCPPTSGSGDPPLPAPDLVLPHGTGGRD